MEHIYFQSYFLVNDIIDLIIDNCSLQIYQNYLDRLSVLHTVNYGMQLTSALACDHTHDDITQLQEHTDEPKLLVENFAPFTLKCNVVYKKVEIEITVNSNPQIQLTDDRVSKKSSTKRYQVSSSRSIPKGNTVPVPQIEQEILFTQVPLPAERIGTAQRADFMVEEKMRVKKGLEIYQEEKLKREKKHQQREKRKQAKLQQKILSDLRDKQFTFDYEGSIMVRGNKAANPSVKFLKEVSFSAEISQQKIKTPEKPIVTNIKRERRIHSMDVTTKQSERNENNKDLYNNGGNRQTSVIPFIRLNRGVTIKEKAVGGKETVLKGQSFLEHDESYRNFILKSQSNSLQRPFDAVVPSSQTDQSIQDVSSQVDDITLPPIMPQGSFIYRESHRYHSFHQRHLHLQKIKRRAKQIPTDTFDFQQEMDRLRSHIQSDPSIQDDIDMINIKHTSKPTEKINFIQSKAKVIKILQD